MLTNMKMKIAIKMVGVWVVVLALNFNSYAQDFLTNGLVAYYPFDGDARDLVGTNNGTPTGVVLSQDRFGRTNSAYTFQGLEGFIRGIYGDNGNAAPNPLEGNFSASIWFKPTGWIVENAETTYGTVYSAAVGQINNPYWQLGGSGIGISAGTNGVCVFEYAHQYVAPVLVRAQSLGQNWVHAVVLVRTNGAPELYLNGVHVATGLHTGRTKYFTLFDMGLSGYGKFNGSLDDIRIYNRALSDVEVAQLFAREGTSPRILTQPVSNTNQIGEDVAFSVDAIGLQPLFYQWCRDGQPIGGATTSTFAITNVQPPRIGDYTVVITNSIGSETSSVASLSIPNVNSALWKNLVAYYLFNGNANDGSGNENNGNATNVRFISNRLAQADSAADFSSGDAFVECPTLSRMPYFPVTYSVWFKLDSFPLPRELYPAYGGYGVTTLLGREVASDDGGALCLFNKRVAGITNEIIYYTGSEALRTQRTPETNRWTHLVFTFDPSRVATFYMDGQLVHSAICATLQNAVMPFRVGASGIPAGGRFGWRGAVDDVRIYNRAMSADEVGQLYASEAPAPPTITQQPIGQVVNQGGKVTLELGATSSTRTLTYQWRKNGVDIVGATASILTLTSVEPSDAGNYTVVIGGGGQTITSAVARLDVIHRATASPVLAFGFVVGGTVSGGGYGYTNIPLVRIVGGGGSGAVAVTVVSNGVVTGITMLNAGFGYTSTPQMIVQPPFIPTPSLAVSPMTELTSSELAPGGNYQLQRGVVGFWTNEMPSFQATSSTLTQLVAGIAGTATYRLVLSPTPSQAFATPQMVNGFVVGVSINAGGSGYVTTPRVVIYGGGGTNATAVASLTGGVVSGIAITSAGIGYTSAPSIRIDPPPAASVTPQQTQVLRLKSTNLSPYDNYRFESTPGIGVGWTPIGSVVVPTESTNTTDLAVTNSAGLFRLRYTP